ncbi:peptidoglycan DD-metalloendopeptidase family protein [Paraburkholderia sp. RL17-368-BIF-A]|jgi:lipoprotein NlpD|uniref:peptidoglycan DD-metalloendopeptidase family protein n=1 Tax=Paraburkholderia sp. RL17-368-BIF-A TaxID=3031628 RepID=UPI0006B3ECCA|nr:peptidase M23 [Burkholderia sp. HB1]
MKICLPRCAAPRVLKLLAWSLAGALSGCSLLSPSTPLLEAPVSSSYDPISAWTAGNASAALNPPTVPAGFYRVNPGDTLTAIAHDFGRDASAIAQWNRLSADGSLRAGQILRVAPPAATQNVAAATDQRAATAADKHTDAALTTAADAKARLAWPVSGAVTEPFVAGKTKGVTIATRAGEQVRAAASGRVVYAGGGIAGYGQLIIVKHDSHLLTAYGNNRALLVKEGAPVKKGQAIAEVSADAAGDASVHFEVRKDGKPVDPLAYLPKRH